MNQFENIWLGEQLLRGFAFLILAGMVWAMLRDGRSRYALWRGAFVILLAMGVIGLGPGMRFIELDLTHLNVETEALVTISEGADPEFGTTAAALAAAPTSIALEETAAGFSASLWLFWIWVAGVCFGSIRLVSSQLAVRKLTRGAKRLPISEVVVIETDSISSPMAVGIFRPKILVPSGFLRWNDEDRRMALRHETAHIRNRDGAWQLLGAFAAVLHWPNPLAWLALRQMERDRELNADTQVLRSGVSPRIYSEFLVRLASSERLPAVSLPMARRSTVPLRVERILHAGNAGKVAFGPLLWMALGLLAGVALTLGVTSFTGGDEPEPEPSVPPSASTEVIPPVLAVETDPVGPDEEGLYTKTFVVPWNFAKDREGPAKARSILEDLGVVFPEGTTAVFNAAKTQLIVRNTKENLTMTEEALEGFISELERKMNQILVSTKIVLVPSDSEGIAGSISEEGSGLAGVFTDPQFQFVIRSLSQEKGVDLISAPSVLTRTRQRAAVEFDGDRVLDLTAAIGRDGYSIDLDFHAVGAGSTAIATKVTIYDGQTVLLTEPPNEEGRIRATFVTARLIDPSGKAVNPREDETP